MKVLRVMPNDPHYDIDHGYKNQYLPYHFQHDIGYFGGGKKGVILTFGWVMIMNTFFRTLTLAGIINQFRSA